jgi:hypothetical protein
VCSGGVLVKNPVRGGAHTLQLHQPEHAHEKKRAHCDDKIQRYAHGNDPC